MDVRPATLQDSAILFEWRNDRQTRLSSHNTAPISFETHNVWLASSLQSDTRKLWIAEEEGPLGTIRADSTTEGCTLSWAVAPEARGRGIAKQMVALVAEQLDGTLFAEVKVGNIASVRVAESVGMALVKEENGVLFYKREKR